jgi:hypothetical protein
MNMNCKTWMVVLMAGAGIVRADLPVEQAVLTPAPMVPPPITRKTPPRWW